MHYLVRKPEMISKLYNMGKMKSTGIHNAVDFFSSSNHVIDGDLKKTTTFLGRRDLKRKQRTRHFKYFNYTCCFGGGLYTDYKGV